MPTPEELPRLNIDKLLAACGWVIQDMSGLNRYAGLGVAVREFPWVRTNDDVSLTYLMYCLAADAKNGKLEKYFTGSTIKHFTGQSLKNYVFALPPLEEQRRIVAEVERLSVARQVESAVEGALLRASRLRQAALKSAFEGRLS